MNLEEMASYNFFAIQFNVLEPLSSSRNDLLAITKLPCLVGV